MRPTLRRCNPIRMNEEEGGEMVIVMGYDVCTIIRIKKREKVKKEENEDNEMMKMSMEIWNTINRVMSSEGERERTERTESKTET